ITGPLLRAVGVPYDVRRAQPYYVYDRLEFEIPTQKDGDNYSRYLVRMAEMEQSMRTAEQALAAIPCGPINVDFEGRHIDPAAYFPVEGANGELGCYVVSDGSDRPYPVGCRPTCLPPLAALHRMIVGETVGDMIPTFGSVNMIGGELDR